MVKICGKQFCIYIKCENNVENNTILEEFSQWIEKLEPKELWFSIYTFNLQPIYGQKVERLCEQTLQVPG